MTSQGSDARGLVLVTVGTDHHPFDRMVAWSERWAANHPDVEVIVQHGASRRPTTLTGYERIPHQELTELMRRADVVVAHGGGGSITQCWETGKLPIVVARTRALGEHVDDHQVAFAERLAEMGNIHLARDFAGLHALLQRLLDTDPALRPTVDLALPNTTIQRIGGMIEDLVRS